jgi:hypothetical protein
VIAPVDAATIIARLACGQARCPCAATMRRGSGNVHCPAHDDPGPSLTIHTRDGHVLLRCQAGCPQPQVLDALRAQGLWPSAEPIDPANGATRNGHAQASRIVATYEYHDEQDRLLFQAVRFAPKAFKQRRPDGRGGWAWNLDGVRRVLYRLPEVLAADPSFLVYVVEGEQDADRLASLGLVATTNPQGGGKWRPEYGEALRGRHVVILPDADEVGERHAQQVAQALQGVAASVQIVPLPGLGPKGDVSDWLDADGTVADLAALVDAAEPQPAGEATADPDDAVITAALAGPQWPGALPPEAYHGLVGEIVHTIEPHSEADPAALLVQVLVAFGSAAGRAAYVAVEADRHYPNLFVVLVGPTAKGRKGTSWGHVRRLFALAAPEWTAGRLISGLASGEALVWSVRDPVVKQEAVRENGRPTGAYDEVITDQGEQDKRLLVMEQEFASVLRVVGRDGNTLSARVREAWDTGDLRNTTKNSPLRATGAHVSIIGHITADELRRYLETTEAGNGFANRHLWACVRRSKALPRGGRLTGEALAPFAKRLEEALTFAATAQEVTPDEGAWAVWDAVYPALSAGRPGLLGAVLSRAEAQVLRLALVYALLDRSAVIRRPHLLAALAVWQYVEASATCVFGDTLGDPLADDLLAEIRRRPAGMTRTEIRDHCGRNKTAQEIGRALARLREYGLARSESEATTGRAAERWFAA